MNNYIFEKLKRGIFLIFFLVFLSPVGVLASVDSPLTVRISMEKPPLLNQFVELKWKIMSVFEAPGTKAEIILPEGVDAVNGPLKWEGDLTAGQTVTLSTKITFLEGGNKKIKARVQKQFDQKNSWGDTDVIYLNIGGVSSRFGFVGLEASERLVASREPCHEVGERKKGPLKEFPFISAQKVPDDQVTSEATAGQLTVTGYLCYYDREDQYLPAEYTPVQLWDKDNFSNDDFLDWDLTDPSGFFEIGPVDNNDGEGGTQDIYLHFVLDTDKRRVENTVDDVYYWYAYLQDDAPSGVYDAGEWYIVNGSSNEGAMWIFQTMGDAFYYVANYGDPGKSTIEWEEDNTDGTYYLNGEDVHLRGGDADFPDTIVHEVGHNYMWNIYGNWFPITNCPNPHYINRISHVNCAWTEGWANFLPLAVYNDPILDIGFLTNIEMPTGVWDSGDAVEGRVAGSLWDIFDNPNDGFDQYYDGFEEIWDTIYNQNDDNFSQYWTAWNQRGHNHDQAVLSILENTIDYRDGTERDLIFENNTIESGETWNFQATNTITAQNNFVVGSGANVTFDANNQVHLQGEFRASNGSEFRARN